LEIFFRLVFLSSVTSGAMSSDAMMAYNDESDDDSVVGVKHEVDSDTDDIDDMNFESQEQEPLIKDEVRIKPEENLEDTTAANTDDDVDGTTFTTSASLQELVRETNADGAKAEMLEAGVTSGLQLLDQLSRALQAGLDHNNTDVQHWIKQIETVRAEAKKTRTIIGVVGNTGAGKSSVVNAVLDEERVVPTNCMRACTAVVTEMSYNDSEDEESKYRAEIEFI